ncbi:hypothetical protein E3J74_07045 [Candidatus Bathyarchaeota archaeon]|nr:MAG: hypothetical protein E3J74_07045 [Candidatus Bathyarchaeota archaeon]
MNEKQFMVGALIGLMLLALALAPLSGQEGGGYNPWADLDGDGNIDADDLYLLANAYGTSGEPLNLPMALEYDSGWVNIIDKLGQHFNITHNLNSSNTIVQIRGKTTLAGPAHRRHFDGTGYTAGWNQTYGGANADHARSVIQTADGGYAIAGYTYSYGAGGWDSWLVKIDSAGNMQWNQTYGGTFDEDTWSMVQTSDGGYALAGSTHSYTAGGLDFWLVKTDAFGLTEAFELGLAITGRTADTLELYKGAIDPYWNYVRIRIWVAKETP